MGTDRSALAVLAGAALLVVVVATTAGGLRPVHVVTSTASQSSQAPAHTSAGGSGATRNDTSPSGSAELRPPDASWLPSGSQIVLIAVLAGVVLTLLASLRIAFVRRRPIAAGKTRGVSPPADPGAEEVGQTLESLLDVRLSTLEQGTPRNAIVAAWIELEDFAVGRGLSRDPADTPAEFVARALAAYDLDDDALERLADLYREARFSTHPLSEAHRDRARACLAALTGSLVPS